MLIDSEAKVSDITFYTFSNLFKNTQGMKFLISILILKWIITISYFFCDLLFDILNFVEIALNATIT